MSTSSDSSTTTAVYAVLSFCGGVLLSCSQLPQIYRVHQRRTTFDISYGYQIIYATASAMFLTYYGYYGIWSIFIPCVMSVSFVLYLMGMKIYLEEYLPREAAACEPPDWKLNSALLPESQVVSDQAGAGSDVQ